MKTVDAKIKKFQFHSGSIKRPNAKKSHSNSTIRFNSIVVRLKVCGQRALSVVWQRFQFHSGSIKRKNWRMPSVWQNRVSIP